MLKSYFKKKPSILSPAFERFRQITLITFLLNTNLVIQFWSCLKASKMRYISMFSLEG